MGGAKKLLQQRLKEFNNKPKEAFVNLEENPIWINEEKGIQLKRVTITGVSNAEPLHTIKDHLGKEIINNGENIPVDYVSTGNNHHVAIYKDQKGNIQERVVSFYEAVQRKNLGLPVIFKKPIEVLDKLISMSIETPIIIENLPEKNWEFQFTMKQNEMFVFPSDGFDPTTIDLMDKKNKTIIGKHLFRVQKISTKNYMFNHHLETGAVTGEILKNKKELSGITFHFIQSEKNLEGIVKVRINHLGDIVHIGEY